MNARSGSGLVIMRSASFLFVFFHNPLRGFVRFDAIYRLIPDF